MNTSSPVPLAPGSYFAELQSLESAKSSGIIDDETFACYKRQLNKIRKKQSAGVSQILLGLDYAEHPSSCGCMAVPESGMELQDLAAGREPSPLMFVQSSGAAVRHLMSGPAGFVHVDQNSDTESPALGSQKEGQPIADDEDDAVEGALHFKVVTEEESVGSTVMETAINTFIAFVGAGILGMPNAFRSVGYIAGCMMMLAIGAVSVYCMLLLVTAKHKARESFNVKSYGDLSWIAGGNVGFAVLQGSLFLTQTGFCCAYLIFIMENFTSVVKGVPPQIVVLVCCCILTPVTLLRHLKLLAPFSTFANMANLTALGIVYVAAASHMASLEEDHTEAFKPQGLTFFFGVAVYGYEGIGMVIPLEDSMRESDKFRTVLSWTMVLVTVIYLSFGLMGYLAWQDDTKGIITLNLSHGYGSTFVKLLLCCGLLFTFPIMIFPVSQLLDDLLLDPVHERFETTQNFVRIGLVMLAGIVALSVPDFGLFISLVGSSCCSILAFIMPAWIHFTICHDDISSVAIAIDWFIVAFGVFAAVISTRQAVLDVIEVM